MPSPGLPAFLALEPAAKAALILGLRDAMTAKEGGSMDLKVLQLATAIDAYVVALLTAGFTADVF